MVVFTLSIAGIPVRAEALYESTARFCGEYLCDETPVCSVSVTPEDIAAEREIARREEQTGALAPRVFSDAYLERLALQRKICDAILERDVLLMHGSVVVFDGRAHLFTAPSGTGKTTHSRLWLSEIPGSYILNGDKPFLRIGSDRVYACGAPWKGKEGYGRSGMLPLASICILERDRTNHIAELSLHDALPTLIAQSNRPAQAGALLHTLELIGKLGGMVRLYRLGCNMELEAAHVCFQALCGGNAP